MGVLDLKAKLYFKNWLAGLLPIFVLRQLKIWLNFVNWYLKKGVVKSYTYQKHDVIFYCEQPSHWQSVQEVFVEFHKMNPENKLIIIVNFCKEVFQIDDKITNNIIYNVRPHELKHFKTKIVYTPCIPFSRENISENTILIHGLVSLMSLDGVYLSHFFNDYDYIICAGSHHLEDFSRWSESNPSLKGVTLIKGGYPKLDLSIAYARSRNIDLQKADRVVVTYAPTHVYAANEKLASFRSHGEEIVQTLINAGFYVILRPHPVSLNDDDASLVQKLEKLYAKNECFELDKSKNYLNTYARTDVMLTDLSGTGFTFSFAFNKPSIFFSPNIEAEVGLSGIQFSDREQIGSIVRSNSELPSIINKALCEESTSKIPEYRDKLLFNVNSSARHIAKSLGKILNFEVDEDWHIL